MSRILSILVLILTTAVLVHADGPPTADATAPAARSSGGSMFGGAELLLLPLVFGFMYFIVIRPQRKEEKKRKELISAVKRGDLVVTIGGMRGEVVAVGEDSIDLKSVVGDGDVVLRFNKGAIASTLDQAKADAAKGK